MSQDPFGNLQEWGQVLEKLDVVFQDGSAEDCQCGLIRLLRYKGNWRLREEALKHIEELENPKEELIREVIKILDDENNYYEARIIACGCLERLIKKQNGFSDQLRERTKYILERINNTPHPPFFAKSIMSLSQSF